MHLHRIALVLAATLLAALQAPPSLASSDVTPEPDSPTLRALAAALDAHDGAALPAFWRRISTEHSPLVENMPDHPGDVLFTFLWHAEPNQVALNVRFNGWFPRHTPPQSFDPFTRLRDSDVWYTSYLLPRNAHLRYELVAPKSWKSSPERRTYFTMDDMEYETFADPLNPRVSEWNNSVTSYAEGPDARTSAYLQKRADVARGKLETLDVTSKVLGNTRTLRIYLPAGYRNDARDYPLLLAYDGNQYTTVVPVPQILDNMIAAHAIPPLVTVFMESPNRDVELPPNDRFQRFVGQEMIPQVRAHYRLSRDPRRNAVLGSSYGGIGAAYTGFMHPEIFGTVISQSGSFWWSPDPSNAPPPFGRGLGADAGWFIKRVAAAPREAVRFHLEAGLWEGSSMLSSNRLLQSVLVGKGYTVTYQENPGNHSSYYWMQTLPDELLATFGRP